MKFGKTLASSELPRYRGSYLNYKALKKLLSSPVPSQAARATAFRSALQDEVTRLNAFVSAQEAALSTATAALDADRRATPASDGVARAALSARAQALATEGLELSSFVELCYTASYKAAKKCDKVTGGHALARILAIVELQPFLSRVFGSTGDATPPRLDTVSLEEEEEVDPAAPTPMVSPLLAPAAAAAAVAATASATTSPEVKAFDQLAARVVSHAVQGLCSVSPELDPESAAFRARALAAPVASLRARLVANSGGVPAAAAELAARHGLFAASARLITRAACASVSSTTSGMSNICRGTPSTAIAALNFSYIMRSCAAC